MSMVGDGVGEDACVEEVGICSGLLPPREYREKSCSPPVVHEEDAARKNTEEDAINNSGNGTSGVDIVAQGKGDYVCRRRECASTKAERSDVLPRHHHPP